MSDALFLTNHPGWSPDDLANAPEPLIQAMKMIDRARHDADKKAQNQSHAAAIARATFGKR